MSPDDEDTDARPTAQGASEPLTPDERERAVQLILCGRTGTGPSAHKDRDLVRRYFAGINSSDLNSALATFEFSEWPAARKEAAQLLIAYFIWCRAENSGVVPIGEGDFPKWPGKRKADSYLLRFVMIGFGRMTGLDIDATGFLFQGFDLPQWQSPDVGFSWKRPAGRPSRDFLGRDIAILCFIERERRRGKHPRRAAREACKQFSETPGKPLQMDTLDRVVARLGCNLKDWQPLTDTDDQLEREIACGLEEAAARRAKKEAASD